MRAINYVWCILILSSCTKQVTQQAEEKITASAITTNTCKPEVFGVLVHNGGPQPFDVWRTLMQKWYDANGKVEYLKAEFYGSDEDYANLYTQIRWAHVVYFGNQVALDEGSGNSYRMRVTLDEQQRPAASYYFHNGGFTGPMANFLSDTTYYYFTGSRLDSTISFTVTAYGFSSAFSKRLYHYDSYGNLTSITSGNDTLVSWTYDYSQPVTDMLVLPGNGDATNIPMKVMEYMDLLHFRVHHKIVGYDDYQLQDNGLVYSYSESSFNKRTYYTGWHCDGASTQPVNRLRSSPKTFEEFQQMYNYLH